MKVVAVILAGGTGARFGGDVPKQFAKLAGREILEYTVEIFDRCDVVDEIVIVSRPEFAQRIWSHAQKNGWRKLSKVVDAGPDRMGSTRSAIRSLEAYPTNTKIVLHDAVRPLLEQGIIRDCVNMLEDFDAVDVVISSADTIVSIGDNGCIDNIPPRASMQRGQTPQAFRLATLAGAYERAEYHGRRDFNCDCGVVRGTLPRIQVATVKGSESNIKITTQLDLFLAEKLIQSRTLNVLSDSIALSELDGRVVAIFGGASGIGKSIRDIAVQHGAEVYVAGRQHNGIDIGDRRSVDDFLKNVSARAGRIDIIINSAAILIRRPLDLLTDDEVGLMVDTNYLGSVHVSAAAKRYLMQTSGALIHFTSSSYTRGRACYAIYSSTKSAVVNLTQALAEEWSDAGIRVNCINPERTRTPMRQVNFGEEDSRTLLDPAEVAISTLKAALANYSGMIVDVRQGRPSCGHSPNS